MVETIGFKEAKSWTLVTEETLASPDKEVELDMTAAGNILPVKKKKKKKTPTEKNKKPKPKPKTDPLL